MEHIDLLFRLLIAHLLGDFVLQSERWITDRKEKKLRSPYLYLHAVMYGAAAYLLVGVWNNPWLPLVLLGSHLVINIGKSYIREGTILFIIDQLVHLLILILLWALFFGEFSDLKLNIKELCSDPKVLWLVFSYLFLIWPSSVIIKKLTAKYQSELTEYPAGFRKEKSIKRDTGLHEAGKWIGILERILILTFILLQQYPVIGLLVAAKSVFRFGDIRDNADRKRIEYILIGTLLSFSIAVLMGILSYFILSVL